MEGSKPRLPGTKGNGNPSKAEVQKLSREYLRIRNRQLAARAFTAEMLAAKARNELIEKRLVVAQASYLLTAMRQKILNLQRALLAGWSACMTFAKPKKCWKVRRIRFSTRSRTFRTQSAIRIGSNRLSRSPLQSGKTSD